MSRYRLGETCESGLLNRPHLDLAAYLNANGQMQKTDTDVALLVLWLYQILFGLAAAVISELSKLAVALPVWS